MAGTDSNEMPGFGFTVTEMLSLVKLGAFAFTVVVHGNVADRHM